MVREWNYFLTQITELNARFRRRKLILDRVCALLPTIAEMKRNETSFEDLLDFHRKIYDMVEKYNDLTGENYRS